MTAAGMTASERMEAGDAAYEYREKADHTVCLLKAFGREPAAVIPEEIRGMPVTEIGAYCFAAGKPAASDRPQRTSVQDTLHELSGSYLESVILPDSVRKLDTCAFYQCTNLIYLSVPGSLETCGSDVFVNCGRLRRLTYRNPVSGRGGLKNLLSQITWDVEVSFESSPGVPEAVVYYPEYTQGYDEIGPAHMFEIYINGEGYRARQSFREDRIYFPGYDAIFPQACVEEPPATLGRMAWDRLAFPVELSPGCRDIYERYIREHQRAVSQQLLQDEEISPERRGLLMETLIRTRCFDSGTVDDLIRQAASGAQAELAASLILWKNRYCLAEKKNRYSFDEF